MDSDLEPWPSDSQCLGLLGLSNVYGLWVLLGSGYPQPCASPYMSGIPVLGSPELSCSSFSVAYYILSYPKPRIKTMSMGQIGNEHSAFRAGEFRP